MHDKNLEYEVSRWQADRRPRRVQEGWPIIRSVLTVLAIYGAIGVLVWWVLQ